MQGFFLIKALDDRFYATYRLVPWQISSEMDVRAVQLEEKLKSVYGLPCNEKDEKPPRTFSRCDLGNYLLISR